MTTFAQPLENPPPPKGSQVQLTDQMVVDILRDDHIQLSKAKRLAPYGRAKLSGVVRAIMWALRIYVLASFLLIALQIAISLQAQQNTPAPTPAALVTPAALSGQDAAR